MKCLSSSQGWPTCKSLKTVLTILFITSALWGELKRALKIRRRGRGRGETRPKATNQEPRPRAKVKAGPANEAPTGDAARAATQVGAIPSVTHASPLLRRPIFCPGTRAGDGSSRFLGPGRQGERKASGGCLRLPRPPGWTAACALPRVWNQLRGLRLRAPLAQGWGVAGRKWSPAPARRLQEARSLLGPLPPPQEAVTGSTPLRSLTVPNATAHEGPKTAAPLHAFRLSDVTRRVRGAQTGCPEIARSGFGS